MSRPAGLVGITLSLLFLLAGNSRAIELQPEGSIASRHLAGEWRLLPELSQRLTGSRTGAPDLVSIVADPSVLASLPPQVEGLLKSRPVHMAGTLTFTKSRFTFLLIDESGSPRLLCFQPGASSSGLSVLIEVIPAKEPLNDLLFLGGEKDGPPFFAYERIALPNSPGLSEETRGLLLDALQDSYSKSRERLAERPDWQSVVDLLTEEIRNDPNGFHNNRLIVLREIVARHLGEIRLDIQPLLALLGSRTWMNQQKAADALAEAVRRPDLFKGKEKAAIRALIPLTASQRGPVVEPALQVLHALTGEKALQRDPLAWARWFNTRFGEQIDLSYSVYEQVAVIASEPLPDGSLSFQLDGQRLKGKEELRRRLQDFIASTSAAGLQPSFVALVPTPVMSAETQQQALLDARPIRDLLNTLGIEEVTVAPSDTVFYAPFNPGFPPRPAGE